MRSDLSYGIIPLKRKDRSWQVCLVQLHAGHWGFPKGHPEPHETPIEAAKRELYEETGLKTKQILSEKTFEENYFFTFQGEKISKKVIYFLAEVSGKIVIQAEEIQTCSWFDLEEAQKMCTFAATKGVCHSAIDWLADAAI